MSPHLKILSSDDDEGIRAFLFSLLTERGDEVEFAKDSDEIFKHLGRTRYDLLILDVNTPGINGYQVAEKITANIINRPKILIFTSRDITAEQIQAAACGADAVLQKGSPCEKILKTIHGLCEDGEKPHMDLPKQITTGLPPEEGAGGKNYPPTSQLESAYKQLDTELQHCRTRIVQVEDLVKLKNLRYEEFIRDLLKEKQRTEKNYLEFKRIETEVLRLKNWGYAVTAMASLAILRSFF